MERAEQYSDSIHSTWDGNNIPLEPLAKISFIQGERLTYAGRRKMLAEMTYWGNSIADAMARQGEALVQYDKCWNRASVQDDFTPKIAVLQLKPDAEREYGFESYDNLTARGKSPDVANYNLVHVRRLESPIVGETAIKRACQKLYAELNSGMQHPYNYFGYSLSVSDIVVVRTDWSTSVAYYVDRYGFVRLPENFLDHSMTRKIALDMDVFQERNALRQIKEWQEQTPGAADFLSAGDLARMDTLNEYLRPIEQLRGDRFIGSEIVLSGFTYDGKGYMNFVANISGDAQPCVFRVYNPADGNDMEIVNIPHGTQHSEVLSRNLDEMKAALREVAQGKYDELTAHLIAGDSRFATLNGVAGEWRTVESRRIDGLNLFLMEREKRDDDVDVPIYNDRIIADEKGTPLLRGVSSFQQYIYEVSQPMHEAVIRAMKRDVFDYNEGIVEIGTEKVGFQKGDWDKPDTLMFFDNWQKAADYVRENRARLLTPIEEVRGFAGVGVLAGSELNRAQVYKAVRNFEQNNLVEHPVIDHIGNYEDKDFLYAAYDEYVAMSHYEELFPYRERFMEAVAEEVSRRENWGVAPNVNQLYSERLAEVYYAKQAGLTDAQIDGVIADGKRDPYLMRQIRKLYQAGYTQEQIEALTAIEKTNAIEYAAEFLREGGNIEVIKSMPPDTDMSTAFYTLGAVTDGIISERAATYIFEAVHSIHSFNEREFAKAQEENPETANYRFTGIDFEFFADTLIAMANPQGGNLDGETILATVNGWLERGAEGQLREQPIVMPENSDKTWVAVESTDDYAEPGFNANLVDADIQNEDGTYGRIEESYRIVVIGNDTSLQPLDNRVFKSPEEALASVVDDSNYRVVSYDDIVHEAMNRRMAAKIPNRRENEMAEQATQQSAEPQEQETLYLFRHTHFIQMPENLLDNRPAYLFISHTLYTLNGDGEAVEVTNIYDESEEQSTAKADARLAEFVEKFRAEHPDRTVAVIQPQEIIGSANAMLPADLGFMKDYASPGAHTQLREEEARAAIKRGVRVDLIARIEDYHGSHEDDYSKRRLTEQDVDEYYSAVKGNNQQNSRFSLYRGAAYLSPDYEVAKVDMNRLKKAVQYFTAQDRGEREATPGVEVIRAADNERLYNINGWYLHIQSTDGGWDYTLYDATMKNLDGGRLTRPELDIAAAYAEICGLQRLDHSAGQTVPLSLLEQREAPQQSGANAAVVENAELSPKDKLQQQLEAGVRSVMDSEVFKNWLSTSSRMFTRQYSFQNAILVWLQKPEASYTMGYEAWKNYGRNVQQGAHGAKIFVPLMASEKVKGGLFSQIKKGLTEQLATDPAAQVVSYRLGSSKLEFTLNRNNHLYGVRMDGKDRGQLGGEEETKRFIERSVLGKIPYGFTVGTVFDVQDVAVPEFLWVKRGYTKDEVVKDEKGRPVKNRRGEVKIINTPERQARFQPVLDTSIAAKDPEKMEKLFDACVAASERKGVPVYLRDKTGDEELNGGAKGYFSRMFSPEYPKGYIVIDKELEITERCAVLMHEMSHADLHGNLEALNQRMGEKVTRGMREVQAEASAFATASQFGISTDTSSFAYLAVYSTGYQLQEFQKSLELIYKEAKALTADIKAELDLRGLNIDLTPKLEQPLEAETIKVISAKYIDFATEQERQVLEVNTEMPELLGLASGNAELLDILRYQRENIDTRKEDVEAMIAAVDGLNKAGSREEQQMQIAILDSAMTRIQQSVAHFESLSEFFIVTNEQLRGGLKMEFENDPEATLQKLSEEYPRLKKLSNPQTEYICTSKFISTQYTKLLRSNPEEFVNKVCERAEVISKVAARNGTFVEVNFCEQWTDKPIFENGTICHPKIAEKIIAASETQIQDMRREAESKGDYFPYAKCDITVYAQGEDGLKGWTTRVDIGDGGQTGLNNFLEKVAGKNKAKNEVLKQFSQAVAEKGAYNSKIYLPGKAAEQAEKAKEKTTEQGREQGVKLQSVNKWKQQIASLKGQSKPQENEERVQKPGRTEKEQGG